MPIRVLSTAVCNCLQVATSSQLMELWNTLVLLADAAVDVLIVIASSNEHIGNDQTQLWITGATYHEDIFRFCYGALYSMYTTQRNLAQQHCESEVLKLCIRRIGGRIHEHRHLLGIGAEDRAAMVTTSALYGSVASLLQSIATSTLDC